MTMKDDFPPPGFQEAGEEVDDQLLPSNQKLTFFQRHPVLKRLLFSIVVVGIALLGLFLVVIIALASLPPPLPDRCLDSEWKHLIKDQNMLFGKHEPGPKLNAYVGNGFIATEIGSDSVYLAGIFNGRNVAAKPTGPSHRARIPSRLNVNVSNAHKCGSALSMDRGVFYRRSMLDARIRVEQRWFAHRVHRHVLVHQITAKQFSFEPEKKNHFDQHRVKMKNGGSGANYTLRLDSLSGELSVDLDCQSTSPHPSHTVTRCRTKIPESIGGPTYGLALVEDVIPRQVHFTPKKDGDEQTWTFLAVAVTERETAGDLGHQALNHYHTVHSLSPHALLTSHTQAWSELMRAGITFDGGPNATLTGTPLGASVNSSLYYILSSIRADVPHGLSPGGLSTNRYNGHSFWDTETWMYPSLLLLHPNLADSLLQYRLDRLHTARAKALGSGHRGMQFPWESAATGCECTPVGHPEGGSEIHINADIVTALKQYHYLTGHDTQRNASWPMLCGIAEYISSRVERRDLPQQGSYEYLVIQVQPPDESALIVNNSVYTNVAFKMALEYAIERAEIARKQHPGQPLTCQHASLPDAVNVTRWADIAAHMYVPFDSAKRMHPEYDGYNGHMINQADVALLQYPLGMAMPRDVAINDLKFYTGVTRPDGYFTGDSVYSIAWLDVGFRNMSDFEFNKSFSHMARPFNVWKEKAFTGGNLNFITGAGCYLQNFYNGYAGIRVQKQGVLFKNPQLPPGTHGMRLRGLKYFHVEFTVNIKETTVEVQCERAGLKVVKMTDENQPETSVKCGASPMRFARGTFVMQRE